jgi:hypothetical protein
LEKGIDRENKFKNIENHCCQFCPASANLEQVYVCNRSIGAPYFSSWLGWVLVWKSEKSTWHIEQCFDPVLLAELISEYQSKAKAMCLIGPSIRTPFYILY